MNEIDEVIEQHGGWPAAFHLAADASAKAGAGETEVAPATVIPFRPRTVEPKPAERYVTCVPLVPLKAAAGAFSDPQHIEDSGFEWVAVESGHRLRKGMFVAQVVGKSMEPTIPDGALCLFRAPVEGTRQGKTVLVQLRDATDPETGQRFTVKRYESEKAQGDLWRHERITLKPVNPDFRPIVLTGEGDAEVQVIAELVEVLASGPLAAMDHDGTGNAAEREPCEAPSPSDDEGAVDAAGQETAAERIDIAALDREDLVYRLRQLFSDGVGRDRDQVIREMAEELGYGRVGHRVREVLDNAIRTSVRRGVLANDAGALRLGLHGIEDYPRDFLKEQFLASLEGRGWKARADAIRDLARWLGFRRTGSVIDETLRSVINGLIREDRLETERDLIRRRA
jgi:SOS-response transcriptional repressor LexA